MNTNKVKLNGIVKYYTAFKNFDEMVNATGYFPSINCVKNSRKRERAELELMANTYDAHMESIGDKRRAWRY